MSSRKSSIPIQWLALIALPLLVLIVFLMVDVTPDLRHMKVTLLSGPEQGNYFAVAQRLAEDAAQRRGALQVKASMGSVDNLEKLAAASASCDAHFAIVQDGLAPPDGSGIELVARLVRGEALLLFAKDASEMSTLADLRGKRIGVGPDKSGTDRLMRMLFESAQLSSLAVKLSNHALDEQLDAVQKGSIDLAAFVLDDDAVLAHEAVTRRGLQVVSLGNLEAVARRHRFLRVGKVVAGQYDPLGGLPPEDKAVLRVDTLVVGNGCASHAATVAFLSLVNEGSPGFIEHNTRHGGSDLFERNDAAQAYFDNRGPDLAAVHVPWLVDLMPVSKWVYIITAFSVLFNIMGFGHRFRLWRIDAARIDLDHRARDLLGSRLTYAEISALQPTESHLSDKVVGQLAEVLKQLAVLRDRCRKQSVSMLVPMGQEMAYRYQEDQIEEEIAALRTFRERAVAKLSPTTARSESRGGSSGSTD